MNYRRLIPLWLLMAACVQAVAQSYASYKAVLPDVLAQPGQFEPLPRTDNPFWRDSIPASMRESYIAVGERYLGQPWPSLPATVFAQFKENGNRTAYESLSFGRRTQLGALVMAEIMEDRGRFLPDIVNGLQAFCEETWWGLPAHYGTKVPRAEDQNVDLFNAETASLIVWTAYMLKPRLDQFSPLVVQRVERELERRILTPALKGRHWWKTAGMNWNPWICSNWLSCVLLVETDRQRQLDAVGQILDAMDAFTNAYPADGGCDEGPGYWDRAAASLFEELRLLRLATSGRIDRSGDAKLRAMGSYAYKTYIDRGHVLSFADSHTNRYPQQLDIVYPFGRYLGDRVMTQFAAFIGQDQDVLHQAGQQYLQSGNFPALGRELFFLRAIREFQAEQPRQPLLPSVWLPDLQIWSCRSSEQSGRGLFVAVKGGTNGESHNHNDVGQIVVYADGGPLLVDAGVGEYTSKTFSAERYSIWTMQSQYHNLPQINGCDQRDGKDYRTTVVSQRPRSLTMELAAAYPPEARVSQWRRMVSLSASGRVSVREAFRLDEVVAPTRLMFITPVCPVVQDGVVVLGNHRMTFDSRQLTPAVEDLSSQLDPLLAGLWNSHLYRLVLTLSSPSKAGSVSYSID